ncbi:MAG: hypothetical protein R3Y24_15790 [Eubacteriales bacterium]
MMKIALINSVKILVFCLLTTIVNSVLSFIMTDNTNEYARLMFYEMYHQEQNIDVLFLGSSHSYSSLVPSELDEIWGGEYI